jgi:hypothetical protein
MKRISPKSIIALISLSIVVTAVFIIACSDYYDPTYSFFPQELIPAGAYTPFYKTDEFLYGWKKKDTNIHDFDSINIDEWNAFFSHIVTKKDLASLIYHARIGEIDTLIYFLKDQKFPLPINLSSNTILNYSNKNIVKQFLFYLGFSKRCETFATYYFDDYSWISTNAGNLSFTDWDKKMEQDKKELDPRNNKDSMKILVDGGLKQIRNVKNKFIYERYLFQIARLYYHAKRYDDCVSFYGKNEKQFVVSKSIRYRTMGYVAGSFYKMKKFGESNYLYSLIYDQYPAMQSTAYSGFAPREEVDLMQSLMLAKTDREKEIIWQLVGIYTDPLRGLKEIYKLDPKSDLLYVLLARAVANAEESFFPRAFDPRDADIMTEKINIDLFNFVRGVADKRNTSQQYVWDLAAGYLSFAKSDYNDARNYFNKVNGEVKNNPMVLGQIHLLNIAMMVQENPHPDKNFESGIVKDLRWLKMKTAIPPEWWEYPRDTLRYDNIYSWTLKKLSGEYLAQGDTVKAELLNPYRSDVVYLSNSNVYKMFAYMDKKEKSSFDRYALSSYKIKKEDILEYQGVNLFLDGKLAESYNKFNEQDSLGETDLPADPFDIHINDNHQRDYEAVKKTSYTKYTFIQRMVELQNLIDKNPPDAADLCFQMANGYYNSTYFGNNRTFYETKILTYNYLGEWEYGIDTAYVKLKILDCSNALKYYLKAMDLSNDKNFKTKCCFMAAKCEQNKFFLKTERNEKINFVAGRYFKELKDSYNNTDYYKEIIKECGYFRTYLSKNK